MSDGYDEEPATPAAGDVKPVDLTGRDRQTRQGVQAMEKIASHFARAARRSMPFLARYKAYVIAGPAEVVGSMSPPADPTLGPSFALSLASADGGARASITLNAEAISFVLEGALGGKSAFWDIPLSVELTIAQRAVLARIVGSLAADYAAALRDEAKIAVAVVPSEMSGASSAKASDVLAVTCAIEGLPVPAKITLCASAPAIESAAREHEGETAAHGDPRMAESVQAVCVEVVAELGRVSVGLRRLLSLQVGDVLRLPTATDDPICVRVGGVEKFAAVPVISRGQLAVEIRARHGA